jgi:hypothetical protein
MIISLFNYECTVYKYSYEEKIMVSQCFLHEEMPFSFRLTRMWSSLFSFSYALILDGIAQWNEIFKNHFRLLTTKLSNDELSSFIAVFTLLCITISEVCTYTYTLGVSKNLRSMCFDQSAFFTIAQAARVFQTHYWPTFRAMFKIEFLKSVAQAWQRLREFQTSRVRRRWRGTRWYCRVCTNDSHLVTRKHAIWEYTRPVSAVYDERQSNRLQRWTATQ